MVSCMLQFGLVIPINGIVLYLSFNSLNAQKTELSEKTIKMHRQLLYSLLFQVKINFLNY